MKNLTVAFFRVSLMSAVLVLAACGMGRGAIGTQDNRSAIATLDSRSDSLTTGSATFTESGEEVALILEVAGATPGLHGAHIHEKGDCSAADASSAGSHWNPTSVNHGAAEPGHLGDLGNIEIGQDGRGTLKVTKQAWKIGDGSTQDVVGKALVIHGGQDDLATNPAGNSGSRVACGVITEKTDKK